MAHHLIRRRAASIAAAVLATVATAASAETVTTIRSTGSSANRIDIVILGDGYTAAQQAQFATDAQRVASEVLAQDPFREYDAFFNVHRIDVVSAQSGADHPEDSPARDVNTALGAYYNCANIERLICVDTNAVTNVLSRSVGADMQDIVLVLVNDLEYGGSGGWLAVASLNPAATEIAIHELGHSFGDLADEYDYGYSPATCLAGTEPFAPNATRVTTRASIKWNAWISPSTPVPTTTSTDGVPGLYKGAVYCTDYYHRPTNNSKMRNLNRPFEQINTEQLIKQVYGLVSPIDAASPTATTVNVITGQSRTFALTLVQPRVATNVATWYVDGVARGTGPSFTLTTTGLAAGTHTVRADVHDDTASVRIDAGPPCNTVTPGTACSQLTERRQWSVVVEPLTDTDNDQIPDAWEAQFGLNPASNDAGLDPDADGRTNLQEYQAGTHPRGFFTRYFAEGATGPFFDTRIALLNVATSSTSVMLRFQQGNGTNVSWPLTIAARSRATVDVESVPGLEAAEFSTVVESDLAVVVDRTMTWDAAGYGSHAETSLASPSTTWYLAEGATHSGFDLFYLVQNPGSTQAHVTVTFLLPSGAPIVKTYDVPARTRFNVWVDEEDARLASTDLSAVITADVPVIVERAMYLTSGPTAFGAGHESAGVTAPATEWFLAEGATGTYFDLFVLVANPSATDATVQATYLLPGGTSFTKTYPVAANSRFNIWVDTEDVRLADTAVSMVVTSTNGVPIVVERAMWWPGPSAANWAESHNSAGLTTTGRKWALAEGEVGGTRSSETYVLIANRGAADTARVTVYYENGTSDSLEVALPATSRTNVAMASDFPNSAGRRFGVVVEALGTNPQIVVERAMYSNAGASVWAAGTNAVATRLQ